MIIDAHVHIGFKSPVVAKVPELVLSMKKAGIDKAMVYANESFDCSTERLLNEIKGYKDMFYPVGTISFKSQRKPNLKQIETWLEENQIYGLKFYLGYEYFYPADEKLRPYLKLLVKYNRPAIFHSGDTYNQETGAKLKYAHPLSIDELAVDMPDLKIIIAHMGNPWFIDGAEVCYKNKNVFADCSGFVCGQFGSFDSKQLKAAVEYFLGYVGDEKKLLFGTDWPIGDQKSYVSTAKKVMGKNEKIFSQNALEVFGIKNIAISS